MFKSRILLTASMFRSSRMARKPSFEVRRVGGLLNGRVVAYEPHQFSQVIVYLVFFTEQEGNRSTPLPYGYPASEGIAISIIWGFDKVVTNMKNYVDRGCKVNPRIIFRFTFPHGTHGAERDHP